MQDHELTYHEDDPKGYGDGLSDFYRCSCGATFQANGDIGAAFEHGREAGRAERDGAILAWLLAPRLIDGEDTTLNRQGE